MKLFTKVATLVALVLSSATILANPHLSPYGVTDGGASHHGAMNLSGNPAAPASIRWEYDSESADKSSFDSGFAMGLGRIGASLNYGQVDDIFDEADRIYDTLENNDSITNDQLGNLTTDAETVLGLLEDKGYVNASLYTSVLPLELASMKTGGIWTLHPYANLDSNANFSGSSVKCRSSFDAVEDGVETFYDCNEYLNSAAEGMSACSIYLLSLLDSGSSNTDTTSLNNCSNEINSGSASTSQECQTALDEYIRDTSIGTTNVEDNCTFDLDSDAAMHLKLGLFTGLGVGYSTRINKTKSGGVFLGIRGKAVSSNLYTTKITYSEIVGEYDNDAQKVIEDIEEDYTDNATSSSGLAVDLGLLWTARNARAGLSVDNVISPKFDYVDENGEAQKFELPQQTRFEASIYPEGRWVHLSYVQDLAEAEAFSGETTQWRTVSVGFTPYVALIHARVGRSEEMVSGLTYITAGASLFSVVHADIGMSTDTVELDGEDQPRGLYGAVSVEFIF